MLLVANHAAILTEETAAPVQATEEIAITKAENTINTKMANMMRACEPWTFQLSNVNEPRYGGYQTARAYAIQGDHSPPQTCMNFSPRNAPTGPAYYRPGPNSQHYPWQGFSPCIYCDEQGHIHTFYRPERWFMLMREYARDSARTGQPGGRVATTAGPQPPQLQ